MKYILSKDKTKMTKVNNIEIEVIRIPLTNQAKIYEDLKAQVNDLPAPEGLSYESDYTCGIRILVNSVGNKLGENYGEYELDEGIQQIQINEFMDKIMCKENIILPTQEEFGKIKGDFNE